MPQIAMEVYVDNQKPVSGKAEKTKKMASKDL
jgi:hypothetical protein